MLLLTESTLFFVNMMRSPASDRTHKSRVLAKVKQWTSRVRNEEQANSELPSFPPSISTATEGPPSTIVSYTTQTTGATSVGDEDHDCDVGMQEEDTCYGGFGEDGNDMQEQEAARLIGKDKVVSGDARVHNLHNSGPVLTVIYRTSGSSG